MNSKKLQNFVKSKVNPHSNVSISFTKTKTKSDSLEEPLFSDEPSINKEADKDILNSNIDENVSNEAIQNKAEHIDFEILSSELLNVPEANNPPPIRSRVEIIGKSVNTALKDAQSAFSAIKENAKRRSIRKPSEVTKGRSKFNLSRKKAQELLVDTDEKLRSKSLTRNEDIVEEFNVIKDPELKFGENVAFLSDENNYRDSKENIKLNEKENVRSEVGSKMSQEDNEMSGSYNKQSFTEDINNVIKTEEFKENANINDIENNTNDLLINFTSIKIIGLIGGIIAFFFFFSISKFILGLICGMLMSFGIFKIYESFYLSNGEEIILHNKYPHLRDFPNPVVPHVEETPVKDDYASTKASYSAWVNAVDSYHPSWNNLSVAYTLHVSIEGTKLRMRRTKNKLTSRHFVPESTQLLSPPTFISDKSVELLHSKVHLLPFGLVRRRMWSKKYPICITLNQPTLSNDRTTKHSGLSMTNSKSSDNIDLYKENGSETNLYFFTKTCREKEEMFRRFMAASLGMPITLTISDIIDKYLIHEIKVRPNPIPLINSNYPEENEKLVPREDTPGLRKRLSIKPNTQKEPQLVTYVRFMAKFMPSDNYMFQMKSQNIKLNYVDCEPELLWLNALIGRLAWDVFRGNFWVKVIREKIQKKLRKVSLPYFIDDLEVTDINLGSELPVIRKVSRPYLDYRGLWVEFNVVYAGGFSMDVETKVNLMKLKEAANVHQKATHNSSVKGSKTISADVGVKYVAEHDSEATGAIGGSNGSSPEHYNLLGTNDKMGEDNVALDMGEEHDLCKEKGLNKASAISLDQLDHQNDKNEFINQNSGEGAISFQATTLTAGDINTNAVGNRTSSFNLGSAPSSNTNILFPSESHEEIARSLDVEVGSQNIVFPTTPLSTVLPTQESTTHTSSNVYEHSPDDSFVSDESDENIDKNDGVPAPNKKLMSLFDRITKSTYFQKASENKYVLKTMEYVSNKTLALQVNSQYLEGTLVLNIPPPPSDRLWWGFKKDVTLVIKAKPKVGQKEIQMTKAVEFVEKQLLQEFRRVVVLPNMDDIAIPLLLNGDPEKYSQNLL